jgi:hypothetical protein
VAGAGQRHAHHPPASSSTTTTITESGSKGATTSPPNAQPLTFCPATFRRVKGLLSFVVLVRRARAQGQPVRRLMAADVLEKNQQLSSAFSSNPFAGAWRPTSPAPPRGGLANPPAVAEHEPTAEFVYARSWKCVHSVPRHTSRVASVLRVDPLGCVPAPPHIPETCPSARSVRQHRARYFL